AVIRCPTAGRLEYRRVLRLRRLRCQEARSRAPEKPSLHEKTPLQSPSRTKLFQARTGGKASRPPATMCDSIDHREPACRACRRSEELKAKIRDEVARHRLAGRIQCRLEPAFLHQDSAAGAVEAVRPGPLHVAVRRLSRFVEQETNGSE